MFIALVKRFFFFRFIHFGFSLLHARPCRQPFYRILLVEWPRRCSDEKRQSSATEPDVDCFYDILGAIAVVECDELRARRQAISCGRLSLFDRRLTAEAESINVPITSTRLWPSKS